MRTRRSPIILRTRSLLLFLLEVAALASYLWNRCVFGVVAEKGNSPILFFITYLGTVILVGCILYSVLVLYTRIMVLHTQQEKKTLMFRQLITLTPLLLLFLTLLEHFVYLRDIQGVLLLVSVLGTTYLQYNLWERLIKSSSQDPMPAQKWKAIQQPILRPKKTSCIVLVLSISTYILYASGVIFPAHPITGDEPHYLLITQSLLSDGDINLFNNYRDKDYLQFYPGELESHALPGKKGHGYEYSKHSPGLPLLLIPPYFIGEKIGRVISHLTHNPIRQQQILIFTLHVSMGVFAALLCWIFFLLVRDFTKNQNVALLSWFILTMTSPLFFYSHLIYPEIPASLLMIVILFRVLSSKSFSSSTFLWIGLGIALLPWLGVKYIILSVGLFGIVSISFWKSGRMRGKTILLFIAPIFISSGLFLFFLWSLYGNIWPSSLYKGFLPSGPVLSLSIFHFKIIEFFRCGLSYLFDQRIGIFPYSPIYLIFVPGVVLFIVRKKRQALPFFGILFLYFAFCSFAYYWGGYCPPGRTLLPVLWILALFMAVALAWGKNRYSVSIHRALLFLSLGITFICAKAPRLLYQEDLSVTGSPSGTYSNLLTSLSNSVVNLRILVPSLIYKDHIVWVPLIFWLLALVLICIVFLKKETKTTLTFRELRKPVLAVFLFSALLIAYTFFDIHLESAHVLTGKSYTFYFQDTNNFGQELEGFWTRGQMASEILVKTDTRASEIRVKLSSPAPGKAEIRVGRAKHSAPRGRIEGQEKTLAFPYPVGFPWKGGYIYSIRVKEDRGFHPYRLDPKVQDNRFLGVFVEIDVEPDK